MFNKLRKFPIISLICLESLLGCGTAMPSYNGMYVKEDTNISDPDFVGEKNWPRNLEIVHRMQYEASGFEHYLGLRFIPADSKEAYGKVEFMLSRITKSDTGAYPNDHPEGSNFYSEKRIYGGSWCTSQVQYWLYMKVPEQDLLDEIYPSHVEDDVTINIPTGDIKPSPNKQNLRDQYNEDKAQEWFDVLADGIEVEVTLIRHLNSDTSGCYGTGKWLPRDEWGEQWSSAKYFSKDPDYSVDMFESRFEDLRSFNDQPIKFFGQIIPGVKDNNDTSG